jgi:hypothetical protein
MEKQQGYKRLFKQKDMSHSWISMTGETNFKFWWKMKKNKWEREEEEQTSPQVFFSLFSEFQMTSDCERQLHLCFVSVLLSNWW